MSKKEDSSSSPKLKRSIIDQSDDMKHGAHDFKKKKVTKEFDLTKVSANEEEVDEEQIHNNQDEHEEKVDRLLDLNKLSSEEGTLDNDPEMHQFVVSMLKIMYPEFF